MRARMAARLRMPSPGLLVALLALVVAMGGTAYAATTTVVNIADPGKPANKAAVNASGQLETTGNATVSGTVSTTIPRLPFFGFDDLSTDEFSTIIAANKATVALTRLSFDDYFDEPDAADFYVEEIGGNATTCDGSSGGEPIGRYDVQPGESFADQVGTPIVLQPLAAGDVWCLEVYTALANDPGSYTLPSVSFSGYVSSGTLPAGAVAAVASATPGAERHAVRGH